MTPPPEDSRPASRNCRDTEDCHLTDIHAVLNRTAADLSARYAGMFAPETVAELLYDYTPCSPAPPGATPTCPRSPSAYKES
jgi:hypothetical protein